MGIGWCAAVEHDGFSSERSGRFPMNQNLQSILELQSALTRLHEAEQRLHGIPDWMRELHEEHTTRKTEIEKIEETAAEAARQRRTAEAAVPDPPGKPKKKHPTTKKGRHPRGKSPPPPG